MKVIVMGCGRVGEQVSLLMDSEGHDVTVIDWDQSALNRLGARFKGKTVRGIGFDREVLERAGIQFADAFTATSSSDNANIISARIARNIYGVPRVIARLYDPRRAEIYRRLGLLTISSTSWGAERIRELLTHSELDPVFTFGNGEVSILSIQVPSTLVSRRVKDLTVAGEILVISITRQGRAFIPLLGTEFVDGDILNVAVFAESMDRLKSFLGLNEGG
jgi:trk system potassium uptake protein TrkA